jgi:hypothetical protein
MIGLRLCYTVPNELSVLHLAGYEVEVKTDAPEAARITIAASHRRGVVKDANSGMQMEPMYVVDDVWFENVDSLEPADLKRGILYGSLFGLSPVLNRTS